MSDGKSNIERVMASTAQGTLREWRQRGAAASNKVQGIRRAVNNKLQRMLETSDTQDLVRGLLWGELTEEQRDYVRGIVPATIPDESITPLVAMVYAVVAKTVRSGDASQLERLLRISGETAELKIKLSGGIENTPFDQLDLTQLSDAELRRLVARERPDDGDTINAEYQEISEYEGDEFTWQD